MDTMETEVESTSFWLRPIAVLFATIATLVALAIIAMPHFVPMRMQLAATAVSLCLMVGALIVYFQRRWERQLDLVIKQLQIPIAFAPHHPFFGPYGNFTDSLCVLARQRDPLLREIAITKLTSLAEEVHTLANGTVEFHSTETWRAVYEKILLTLTVKAYLSVAWVKTSGYWNDIPGRRSLKLNQQLVQSGYHVERNVIVRDRLWPSSERLPAGEVLSWLKQQSDHGIHIRLVRESVVAEEPDLLCDFGIYGTQAVGEQELDESCRTLRFSIRFDSHSIQLAHDRWERLHLYTTELNHLLDGDR
jgi:hypothetical protein